MWVKITWLTFYRNDASQFCGLFEGKHSCYCSGR